MPNFSSLAGLEVAEKVIRISQDFTFPEVPPLIWEVPLLIWEVPPLIWCKLRIKPISPAKLELGLSLAIMIRSVIGPEEMPILVWGWRRRPQTKMGST